MHSYSAQDVGVVDVTGYEQMDDGKVGITRVLGLPEKCSGADPQWLSYRRGSCTGQGRIRTLLDELLLERRAGGRRVVGHVRSLSERTHSKRGKCEGWGRGDVGFSEEWRGGAPQGGRGTPGGKFGDPLWCLETGAEAGEWGEGGAVSSYRL